MPVTINGSTGLTGVAAIDSVSSTELGYVDGVTSAIQTQFNNLGQWQAYTPTWTNLTVGNSTVVARYTQIGKTVHVAVRIDFGSTGSVSGIIKPSLPVTMNTATSYNGAGWCFDASAVAWYPLIFVADQYYLATTSTAARVNATYPFSWATSDILSMTLTYEAA